jgi:hypothetical protein
LGVLVDASTSTLIGGDIASERNAISNNGIASDTNTGDGIFVTGSFMTVIQGNYIGLSGDGSPNFGNKRHGIAITGNTALIGVGGSTISAANTIVYNGGAGIRCFRSSGTDLGCSGASFLVNFIYLNGGLGVDLFDTGITTNDPQDADTGPNGIQNYPEIITAGARTNETFIIGVLDSRPSRAYSLYFFEQDFCDPSGHGEGLTFLLNTTVTTDASGRARFNVVFPNTLLTTSFITALATDSETFDTSEFSSCRQVQNIAVVVTPKSGLQTTESGGQATFTVQLSTFPSQDVTIDVSTSDATEGTVSPAALTFTPLNANIPQTVTVTGVADTLNDGNQAYTVVLAPITSSDPGYNLINPEDVLVTNVDVPTPPPPPPPPGPCSPRPAVGLNVVPDSAGRLRVTLTASGVSTNRLSQLRVISTANAEVELDGQPPRTGPFTVPLGEVPSATFRVRRVQAGQATTVRLAVTDGCGEWETLVGGGANAFP